MLNSAKDELLDEEKRLQFNVMVKAATEAVIARLTQEEKKKRKLLAKEMTLLGADISISNATKAAMPDFSKLDSFEGLCASELRENLIAAEWKKRQILKESAEEEKRLHLEKEKKQAVVNAINAEKKEWEDTRDLRVNSWRAWTAGTKRKTLHVPKMRVDDEENAYIRRPPRPEQRG